MKKNTDTQSSYDAGDDALKLGEQNAMDLKLLHQDMGYMTQSIDELRKSVDEMKRDIKDTFVNKDQFNALKSDVDSLKNGWGWVIKIIIGTIIVSLLALVGLKK